MGEAIIPGDGQERRPPSRGQYETMSDLVREFPSGVGMWGYTDDGGTNHTVVINNYGGDPPKEDPNALAFVNHTDLSKPHAPTLYYLEITGAGMHLRVEEFDTSIVSDAFSDMMGMGLADRADAAMGHIEDAEFAREFGVDAADAAQAQQLIDVLSMVKERGSSPS